MLNLPSQTQNEKGGYARVLGAAFFIASTNIGVAYFIIPILTGVAGFIPAIFITLAVWAFTLAVGLLFAEATLGQPDGSHIISISKVLVGKVGTVIFALVFFLNMITYLTAYTFFIENSLKWFSETYLLSHLPHYLIGALSTIPFFFIVFLGMRQASWVNSILIFALLFFLGLTLARGSPFVNEQLLHKREWQYLFYSVPILFSAFGFVAIVPPVCTYLRRDPKKIRLALVAGSLIPLIVYLVWQWFVIGTVATGTFWLLHEEGIDMEKVLNLIRDKPNLIFSLNMTLFFSMATSMIGNGIGLVEFISDGFKIPVEKRKGWNRLLICLALVAILMLASSIGGQPFFAFLQHFTSPIGEVLIDGFLPIWLAAQARYVYKSSAPTMLPGKHISLMILGVAIFILIYLEGVEFIKA